MHFSPVEQPFIANLFQG